MDTNLLPTGAAHPGHGRPVAPGQASTATTTADSTASDSSGTAAAGVEITISAEAAAVLANPATLEGPGKSGASPAHMARGGDYAGLVGTAYEGLAGEAYKNFGQLVSAIARGLDALGTEEPVAGEGDPPATDEIAAEPATDETVAVPDTSDDVVVSDTTEETTDGTAEETAAPNPVVTEDVVVDTEEAVVAEVVDTEEPAVAEPVVDTGTAVIDDSGIAIEADSLEDALLDALAEDTSEVA